MNSILLHVFNHAEHYTIALVWLVVPLAGLFAYFRMSSRVTNEEEFDAAS